MKKIILIALLLITTLSFTNKNKSNYESNNKFIHITVLDSLTHEPLSGVNIKSENNNIYTDFDGKGIIKNDSNINIYLISYEKMNTTLSNNDTILLKSIF